VILAILALIVAVAGSADAKKRAKKIGLGGLTSGAQTATYGVGPLTYERGLSTSISPGGIRTVTATCPYPTEVIGGGVHVTSTLNEGIIDSHPTTAYATVICATTKSSTGIP
jgi:hypothetical protein